MASVSKKDIPVLAAFMPEFWEFMKKYYIPEPDNDSYWSDLLSEASALYNKYPSEPLIRGFVMQYVSYLSNKKVEGEVNGGSSD